MDQCEDRGTSTDPSLQDATTSTSSLNELTRQDEPKMTPPHLITYQDLDELMNILFCETEESERLFLCQTRETLRRDFVLMEHKKKVNELNTFTQSTAAAMEKIEGNLFYINHSQRLMEQCISSLLELYLRDTRALPADERGSFYKQMLSINMLRKETMISVEDLSAICSAENEVNDDILKLQILGILNYHYQVLCSVQLRMDTLKQTIEKIQNSYKCLIEQHPFLLSIISINSEINF